ncbi:MAG: B12-binding domain-containing radical SAM protein [Desulfurococcales archaeon]|nr:B12-binding domain-containing radical SAM protein [Desulfurococcales archaeon]
MSDHHGKIFIGFAATGPAIGIPEKLWKWVACPSPGVDAYGKPKVAPYALRKLEAALQNKGFNAHVIDPDYVPYYVLHGAKALMIGHHDYFALGPPSNEWWLLTERTPINRKSFIEFISHPAIWEAKRKHNMKIVIGGPAVWQWEACKNARKKWPVDLLVEGEADKAITKIAEHILDKKPLPSKIIINPQESPSIDEIPEIKHPSIGGLVEIMRGCPRGCKFCSVTLRPLRFIPLDKIESEILVNLQSGINNVVLHSEDILLYGADVVKPRAEPLLKLHKMVARHLNEYEAGFAWSHVSLAAVKYAEEHGKIISRITNIVLDDDVRKFYGAEVGIETGSIKLARKIMPAKAAPYPVESWPEVVEDAFNILIENNIFPAATFILGLPGETEDDVYATIELLERLKSYPSLIVPMFFVPMGALKDKDGFKSKHVKEYHREAMLLSGQHSIKWAKWIINQGYLNKPQYMPLKMAVNYFIKYAERKIQKHTESIEVKLHY